MEEQDTRTESYGPQDFKTSVFGFSGGIPTCQFAIVAFIWNSILFFILDTDTDALFWLVLNIVMGIVIQIALLYRRKSKYNNPVDNFDIESIYKRAGERLGITNLPELWLSTDEKLVLAHSANVLFSAVLVSRATIEKMTDKPVAAEVIFADEMLYLGRQFQWLSILGNTFYYMIYSSLAGALMSDLFAFIAPIGPIVYQIVIYSLSTMIILFIFRIHFGQSQRTVEDEYRMDREQANYEVFGSRILGPPLFLAHSKPSQKGESEMEEFQVGMLVKPLIVAMFVWMIAYLLLPMILGPLFTRWPFTFIPLTILCASIGFAFDLSMPRSKKEVQKFEVPGVILPADEQVLALESRLREIDGLEDVIVNKRQLPYNYTTLQFESQKNKISNTMGLSDEALLTLTDTEELFTIVLSEIERAKINKSDFTLAKLFYISLILIISAIGAHSYFFLLASLLEVFLTSFLLFIAASIGAIFILHSRSSNKKRALDSRIVREYPTYLSALRNLSEIKDQYVSMAWKRRYNDVQKHSQVTTDTIEESLN